MFYASHISNHANGLSFFSIMIQLPSWLRWHLQVINNITFFIKSLWDYIVYYKLELPLSVISTSKYVPRSHSGIPGKIFCQLYESPVHHLFLYFFLYLFIRCVQVARKISYIGAMPHLHFSILQSKTIVLVHYFRRSHCKIC